MEINELKKVSIKYRTCYYFGNIIKTKDLDFHSSILSDKKSYESILTCI